MHNLWRRSLLAALLVLVTAAGSLLMSRPAEAQTVHSGSLTLTSEEGDSIGLGNSYTYSTEASDSFTVSADPTVQEIGVSLNGVNGDFWNLNFAAPADEVLAPGVYEAATRWPFNDPAEPGLAVFGNFRACNTLTGSFTINGLVSGPKGYIQTLDATFEQHCEGMEPALRGQIRIDNPPPPDGLELGYTVAAEGTASALTGRASVHGTVTCNVPADVHVGGRLTQVVKRVIVTGSFGVNVGCTPGSPTQWAATVTPEGSTPFQKGDVENQAESSAVDPNYGGIISVSDTSVVRLKNG